MALNQLNLRLTKSFTPSRRNAATAELHSADRSSTNPERFTELPTPAEPTAPEASTGFLPRAPTGTYRALYSFGGSTDGDAPGFGTLAIHNGALFGTTEGGLPFGVAFEVGPCTATLCREKVVHAFGTGLDGAQPIGGVVFDPAGNMYGTTSEGGSTGFGTVFEITASGTETTLYNFAGGTDAANPPAGVTLDSVGNLYGTSSLGTGAYGYGAIYKLTRSGSTWTESILYNFQGADDGQYPVGGVIVDRAGNIYGGTFAGGINGGGTVYELSPSGGSYTFNTLYSFTGGFSGVYNKLTFDTHGNLYGSTTGAGQNGYGLVFKLTPAAGGWNYTDLYDFADGDDGGQPYGSLAVDSNGNIFGTTNLGGTDNEGVIFEITP